MPKSLHPIRSPLNVRRLLVILVIALLFSSLFYTVLRLSGLAGNEMLRITAIALSLAFAQALVTMIKPLHKLAGDAEDPEVQP
jgi:hypothetical protein